MAFEFLLENYIDTTTSLTFSNNASGASFMLRKNKNFQWVSDSLASDSATATITLSFNQTTNVSRIALLETNVKAFDIYYNGATANTFAFTTTASTSTSQFSSNSETALFMRANTVACTSVTFDLKSTFVADSEKAIGYMYIGDTSFVFPSGYETPPANGYKVKITPKQVIHRLSDGGTRIHRLSDKFTAQLKYKYLTTSIRDSLKSVYDANNPFWFAPFGTTTSWDQVFHECVWNGSFDFFQFSDNAQESGFSGRIDLKETTE